MNLEMAEKIARAAIEALLPHCTEATIAGSIRRQKPEVKDIELVVVPKMDATTDLFGNITSQQRARAFINAVHQLGTIERGSAEGRYAKIATRFNIAIDLFITAEHDYWRQVAIRTGPAEYSHRVLAIAWNQNGWVGTENGLRRSYQCINKGTDAKPRWVCNAGFPKLPPTWKSERELYEWLGLNYVTPDKRSV